MLGLGYTMVSHVKNNERRIIDLLIRGKVNLSQSRQTIMDPGVFQI